MKTEMNNTHDEVFEQRFINSAHIADEYARLTLVLNKEEALELAKEYANVKNTWIKFTDEKPEIGSTVDMWSEFGFRICNVTYKQSNSIYNKVSSHYTHWMPIPSCPA